MAHPSRGKNKERTLFSWQRSTGNALICASAVLLVLSTGEITADLSYILLILSTIVLTGPIDATGKPVRVRGLGQWRSPQGNWRGGNRVA